MTHTQARKLVIDGFSAIFGRPPTRPEAQCIQAVGWLESRYGTAWRGAGIGSNNWGAIQAKKPPCDAATMFHYEDSYPTSSGGSVKYAVCFKRYPTPAEGARDLVRIGYQRRRSVLSAATLGDVHGVSAALYDTSYYQGFGPTRDARIANHYKALIAAVTTIARELGEPMPDNTEPLPRTLRLGITGEDVLLWQKVVGTSEFQNGSPVFGVLTREATSEWQAARAGLAVDGIVGPMTWGRWRQERDDSCSDTERPGPG